MNPERLIGKKVYGFKFENIGSLIYDEIMDKYIGKIGEITKTYKDKTCRVDFEDDYYFYPADQIEAHLVDDEIPTFTKEDLRTAYKIGFNLIMSKSRKETDKHFENWYQKRFEPTKEEQLTAILGSSEKVSEIMELFKNE